MKKLLVVVDFQNDFIDGALGTPEAEAIVPNVIDKVKNWDGDIWFTADTHDKDYMNTNEGKHLPVIHCVENTNGWELRKEVAEIAREKLGNVDLAEVTYKKATFGSTALAMNIQFYDYDYVEFIGLCTDICVASNAIMLKAFCPEIKIVVDPTCCAGVTPETHTAALTTMQMCQIDVPEE